MNSDVFGADQVERSCKKLLSIGGEDSNNMRQIFCANDLKAPKNTE